MEWFQRRSINRGIELILYREFKKRLDFKIKGARTNQGSNINTVLLPFLMGTNDIPVKEKQ